MGDEPLDLNVADLHQTHVRALHFAIHFNDERPFREACHDLRCVSNVLTILELLYDHLQLRTDWVESRMPLIQFYLCLAKLSSLYKPADGMPLDLEYWQQRYQLLRTVGDYGFVTYYRQRLDLALGYFSELEKEVGQLSNEDACFALPAKAALYFFAGQHKLALKTYDEGRKFMRRMSGDTKWNYEELHAFLYGILLISLKQKYGSVRTMTRQLFSVNDFMPLTPVFLDALTAQQEGDFVKAKSELYYAAKSFNNDDQPKSIFEVVCYVLVACWLDLPKFMPDTGYVVTVSAI